MSETCGVCHDGAAVGHRWGAQVCADCLEWAEYWDSLTPEERREEYEAMNRYATEASEREAMTDA